MPILDDEKAIIFDLEYTSWEGSQESGWNESENQYKEIIQISAIKIDTKNLEELEHFNLYVKPKINSKLSEYIKSLTKINQSDINTADSFDIAIEKFSNWNQEKLQYYSHGNDLEVIVENFRLNNIPISLDQGLFNDLKSIFKSKYNFITRYSSGELPDNPHNALVDVREILKFIKKLNKDFDHNQ